MKSCYYFLVAVLTVFAAGTTLGEGSSTTNETKNPNWFIGSIHGSAFQPYTNWYIAAPLGMVREFHRSWARDIEALQQNIATNTDPHSVSNLIVASVARSNQWEYVISTQEKDLLERWQNLLQELAKPSPFEFVPDMMIRHHLLMQTNRLSQADIDIISNVVANAARREEILKKGDPRLWATNMVPAKVEEPISVEFKLPKPD